MLAASASPVRSAWPGRQIVRACAPCMSAWTRYAAMITGPGSPDSSAR